MRKNVSTIITLVVSFVIPLLPIITIITYYYVFETEQLADGTLAFTLSPYLSHGRYDSEARGNARLGPTAPAHN